ncbi:MAG: hypothetical protein GQ574_26795 [Crocinitomix sp.]|nr:hypothetical protein [Crocinitomix sp.]
MEKKKGKKSKIMFLLVGLGVVGIAGMAYYFYNKNKQGGSSSLTDFISSDAQASLPLLPASPRQNREEKGAQSKSADTAFPIKKGSKGKLVKLIQLALMKKYGKDILPKWGADGQWGKETTDALIANGYPSEIDKNTFIKFIGHGVAESLSISGLQGNDQLKTIKSSRTWNVNGQKLPIPKDTIIGDFVDAKNGVTTFQTIDNRTLFILTKDISYV